MRAANTPPIGPVVSTGDGLKEQLETLKAQHEIAKSQLIQEKAALVHQVAELQAPSEAEVESGTQLIWLLSGFWG